MLIDNYPCIFSLAGESWELEKNTIRRVKKDGEEDKLTMSGDVTGVEYSEKLDEYVFVVDNLNNSYSLISKKHGWIGPFEKINSIEFDMEKGTALVHGRQEGGEGIFEVARHHE